MKKSILLLLLIYIAASYQNLQGAVVTSATAQTIATNFFRVSVPAAATATLTPYVAYTKYDSAGNVDFYVFNMSPMTGFVIVPGNDILTPLLGYSTESNFTTSIPAHAAINDWVKSAGIRIEYAVAHNSQSSATVQALWTAYATGQNPNANRSTTVGPLMTTTWNQNPYYNALCPPAATVSTSNNKSVTGCVATTMAQTMKYWNYPAKGTGGTYLYIDNVSQGYQENYGSLTTNLDYPLNWANMPNNVTSNTSTVDSLMYECGVSVDMDYSPNGSGAFVRQAEAGTGNPCAQYSYVNYFYYNSTTMQGVTKSSYTNPNWVTLMEGEINAGRVVEYEGDDATQGGHTWILDGYQTSTTATGGALMHMNWGWGGYDDGYFDVTNLLTTNGGFDPVQNDAALIGILPEVTASVNNTPVCAGTTAQLSVTTGTPTGVAYSWSPTTGLGCATCATTSVTATATTTYTVTASITGYGTIGTASVTVNVSPLPAAPTSVTLPIAPCTGATATYSVPAVTSATSYTWSVSGTGWTGTSTARTITLTAGTGAATVSVTANNACGSSSAYVFTAPHGTGPSAPTSVTLPTTPCAGSTAVYTVPAVTGATSYTWTVSGTGWSSTGTTRSATLTAGTVTGSVSVTANNSCGASTAYTFTAPVGNVPAAPASVTLPAAPCNGTTAAYTIPAVTGATSYTWTINGTGWSGTSTSTSATLTAGSIAGTITVKANNTCGASTGYTFTAPIGNVPAAPASVTLPAAPCTGATAVYTIPAVTGATSYTWTISGTGWSGTSTSTSATLTAGTGAGTVTVKANNACGTSAAYTFTAPHGTGPAAPASVTLPTTPCTGATAIYTVPAVSGATSYTWSINGTGWTGTSTTNSITLTAGSTTASVSVTANSACGSSSAYTFTATHGTGPAAPASVTLPTAPCTGATAVYTVPAVSGATSYTWSVTGTGWSGTSTTNSITYTAGSGAGSISVIANNACGSSAAYTFAAPHAAGPAAPTSVNLPTAPCTGASAIYTVSSVTGATAYIWSVSGIGWSGSSTTNSITLIAGTSAGSVSVIANNGCGSSAAYTFSAPHGAGPSAPASVTMPATPCEGATAFYTIPAVSGATSYTWSVSGTGWSGTSTTNNITLTAGSVAGSVSVTANNACGSSTVYVFTTSSNPTPVAPASVTLPTAPCTGSSAVYTVPAVSGATSYTWTVAGTGWSGTSTTNVITLTAGSGTGSISVTANNTCGSSTAYAFTAPHSAGPAAPAAVTLPSTPCQGTTAAYTIPAVAGATSYTWTVSGTGWSGTSTTTAITLTAGSAAGSISVAANNACGSSTAYVFTAPANTLPAAATITAPSVICSGQPVTFTTPAVAGASSYDWAISGTGWTGSSTTNSITLSPGTGVLNISVNALNSCGSGTASSLSNISVTPTPVATFTLNSLTIGITTSETVTFNGTAPTGTTYTWDFDGGAATPGTGGGPQIVTWNSPGTKTVTLTLDNGGCTSSAYTDTVQVVKSTTGINAISASLIDAISVVPNPAYGQVTVTITTAIETQANVSVYDMAGRSIGTIYDGVLGEGKTSILFNTESIAAGVYLVKASDGRSVTQTRFIKL